MNENGTILSQKTNLSKTLNKNEYGFQIWRQTFLKKKDKKNPPYN